MASSVEGCSRLDSRLNASLYGPDGWEAFGRRYGRHIAFSFLVSPPESCLHYDHDMADRR